MAKDFIELASKVERNQVDYGSSEVAQAEKLISEMAETESGRSDLANIIKINVEDEYNKFDIIPLTFDKKTFRLGDKPMFKTHKKGIKAYWAAPNSFIPNSQNYETEIFMQFESLGARPTCLLSDLKTGRVSSLAELYNGAVEAMEIGIFQKVYEVIAQTYNATGKAKDNYTATNSLTQAVLDSAINKVRKKVGGQPTIYADYDLCTKIETFDGFKALEAVYTEIRNNGVLGKYRGCDIVYLPEIIDPVSQMSIVPTNKMFVVGRKIGIYGEYADMDVLDTININDKSWELRIDKECGFAITKPEGIHCIEITG